MDSAKPPLNLCGSAVRRLRVQHDWTQAALSAKCQIAGLDFSRDVIARIEGRTRALRDTELAILARVFRVPVGELFPR